MDTNTEESTAEGMAAELELHRKRERTRRAREQSLLSRQRRKLEQTAEPDPDTSAKATFQRTYFAAKQAKAPWWNPFEEILPGSLPGREDRGRRRAVWMYFTNFAEAVQQLFLGSPAEDGAVRQPIEYTISINTCDDTNIKLLSGQRGSAEIRSVMANIQHHVVVEQAPTQADASGAAEVPTIFAVHQPIISLHRATADHLKEQLLSWQLSFGGLTGKRFHAWGVPPNLFKFVKHHVFVLVSDALKANDAIFRELAQQTHAKSIGDKGDPVTLVVHIHCGIHQISLTRRTLALGFDSYWSTLVRLGHLMESHSFRQRFSASLSKVVHDSFMFYRVGSLPAEVVVWKQKAIQRLRLATALPSRLRHLIHHMKKDNGDPCSDIICHYCIGEECCPGGETEALTYLINSFCRMFSRMPVPLLYRWKHAPEANNFVRDGFFWHNILVRALKGMPAMKGRAWQGRSKYL